MKFWDVLYVAGGIVVSLGGGAVVVIGLSSWLGKLWAQRILQQETAELQRLTHQHNIRFSSIHAKQAELIAELYGLLRQLRDGVGALCSSAEGSGFFNPEGQGWSLKSSALDAKEFYEKNLLYFSEDLSKRMEDFIDTCGGVSDAYLSAHYCDDPVEKEGRMKEALKSLVATRDNTDKAMQQLVQDFRALLGVPK